MNLVVTVGTSAIYNGGIGKRLETWKCKELRDQVESYKGSQHRAADDNKDFIASLVREHKYFWDQPKEFQQNPMNSWQTSAELMSTQDIVKQIPPNGVLNGILLISSDTDEGEFAAEVNYRVLRTLNPKTKIDVHRLRGLDRQFEGVFESLDQVIREWCTDEAQPIAVNVTGGFKGTVLFVAAHALIKPWTIYYRHEDMNRTLIMNLKDARWAIREMPR